MSRLTIPQGHDPRSVGFDPSITKAVGRHHTLASAVADLVDNSIDAEASQTRIRFLLDGEQAVGLQVVDDGHGMDERTLEAAMTYARKRDYDDSDLGHFGVGLKTSSLSQAHTLLVATRAAGRQAVGCRLDDVGQNAAPQLSVLTFEDAETLLASAHPDVPRPVGTVVEWRNPINFATSTDPHEQRRWLQDEIRTLRLHLGIVFHRLIASERIEILIDTVDVATGASGTPRTIPALDPFGYAHSARPDYPQGLVAELPDRTRPVSLRAHLWPPRSTDAEFRLGRASLEETQGFYVYRKDRLLQAGGWSEVRSSRPDWSAARVELELEEGALGHVTINPEKSGVVFTPDLRRAIETAVTADGTGSFTGYLEAASAVERQARSRTAQPISVVRPEAGLSPTVISAFENSVEFDDGTGSVDIRWHILPKEQFFEVNREENELRLNLRYRSVVAGFESRSLNDTPLVKALAYLLLNHYFEGSHPGPREKRELAAWQEILLAAVLQEAADADRRDQEKSP